MSEQTEQTEQSQAAENPSLLGKLESLGLGAETLAALANDLDETKLAVLSIPDMLELHARATLAVKFITTNPQGGIVFRRSEFEQIFAALAGYDFEEKEPVNPQ